MLRTLARAVWPLRCAGCGAFDQVLCGGCAGWYGEARWCPLPGAGGLTGAGALAGVWGVSAYGGRSATLLSAWKERGRHDLTPLLALGLAHAVHGCLTGLDPPPDGVLLVPVPASRRARRRRGTDLVGELAAAAAGWLGDGVVGGGVTCAPVLRTVRRVRDQAGLDAAARRANLAGALAPVRGGAGVLAGRACVVVDDVVTTGATVREVIDVLRRHGAQPVGACCLSVTLRQHGVPNRGVLH